MNRDEAVEPPDSTTLPESGGILASVREFFFLVVIAVAVAALLRTFVVQVFFIPSGSMENTLQVGDRVLVSKLTYHVRDITRGDIVVFDGTDSFSAEVSVDPPSNALEAAWRTVGGFIGLAPLSERDFVKRVIGIPGDRVVCCDAAGRVTVNGVALDEQEYLYPGDAPSSDRFDVLVPEDSLFVLGDHRSASADSRAHLGDPGGGFVPVDRVIGRVFVVAFPLRRAQITSIPETFGQPGLTTQSASSTAGAR